MPIIALEFDYGPLNRTKIVSSKPCNFQQRQMQIFSEESNPNLDPQNVHLKIQKLIIRKMVHHNREKKSPSF